MGNAYTPSVAAGWQQAITGPPVESVACVLCRQDHIFIGRRLADGIPVGLGGTPGGDLVRSEASRDGAHRIVLAETGLDVSAHYLVYSGKRNFPVRGTQQPVHMYFVFLEWAARDDSEKKQRQRAEWPDDKRNKYEQSLRCGDPLAQPGGRFHRWDRIHLEEAEARPQIYTPVIRWALEIICRKPAEVEAFKAVPITQVGHIGDLHD